MRRLCFSFLFIPYQSGMISGVRRYITFSGTERASWKKRQVLNRKRQKRRKREGLCAYARPPARVCVCALEGSFIFFPISRTINHSRWSLEKKVTNLRLPRSWIVEHYLRKQIPLLYRISYSVTAIWDFYKSLLGFRFDNHFTKWYEHRTSNFGIWNFTMLLCKVSSCG